MTNWRWEARDVLRHWNAWGWYVVHGWTTIYL